MALPVTSNTKELKLFSVHQTPSTTANKGTLAINQRQAIAIRLQKEKKGWSKSTATCWVSTAGTTQIGWISGSEHFAALSEQAQHGNWTLPACPLCSHCRELPWH